MLSVEGISKVTLQLEGLQLITLFPYQYASLDSLEVVYS